MLRKTLSVDSIVAPRQLKASNAIVVAKGQILDYHKMAFPSKILPSIWPPQKHILGAEGSYAQESNRHKKAYIWVLKYPTLVSTANIQLSLRQEGMRTMGRPQSL